MHVILEHAAGNIIMHVVRRPGDEAMYMYVPLKLSHVFGLSQSEFTWTWCESGSEGYAPQCFPSTVPYVGVYKL